MFKKKLRKKKVLVVEGIQRNHFLYQRLKSDIENHSDSVLTIAEFSQASDILEKESFDAVVLHWNEDKTRFLIDSINTKAPQTTVIITTNGVRAGVFEKCGRFIPNRVIESEFSILEIQSCLKDVDRKYLPDDAKENLRISMRRTSLAHTAISGVLYIGILTGSVLLYRNYWWAKTAFWIAITIPVIKILWKLRHTKAGEVESAYEPQSENGDAFV